MSTGRHAGGAGTCVPGMRLFLRLLTGERSAENEELSTVEFGAISDRKAGIALNDLLAQQRPLARFPERCRVDDPVAKRTAIGTIAARDRAWNADELGGMSLLVSRTVA